MKIIICNGSPKGENSITLQYATYIQKQFPEVQFETIHIAHNIKKIETSMEYFNSIIDSIRDAQGVIWSFGLWVLCVSAQFMRFFELVQERHTEDAFSGKYAGILSTSIHYFDHTAQEYMKATSEDLGMIVADQISPHMQDLRNSKKREMLKIFGENLIQAIESSMTFPRRHPALSHTKFTYSPSSPQERISTKGKKILILTDNSNTESNSYKMAKRFQNCFKEKISLVDLNSIDIKGACLGCMRCGYDYTCVYRDGFSDFYNSTVRNADIIIHAGEMKGRYLTSLWKTFFDRAFFWNHTPSLEGKQLAYLISGPVSQNSTLIQILEAHASARQHANHAGIISDETADSGETDRQIDALAVRLIHYSEKKYVRPEDFLGTGGWKIFRDEIFNGLRMVWQADHRYFKRNGYYDFPDKKLLMRAAMSSILLLSKIPGFRKKFYGKLNEIPAKRMSRFVLKEDR